MRRAFMIIGIEIALVCGLALREWRLGGHGDLRLDVLDVGQGTAVLLTSPSGKHILVDGGPDWSVLEELPRHMPFFDRTIELLVLSHPDADHLNGLLPIIERYRVGAILLTGIQHSSQRYAMFLRDIQKRQIPVHFANPAQDIVFDDGLFLDVVWPPKEAKEQVFSNPNDTSVIIVARFGSSSVLLPGDIETPAEKAILSTGQNIDADIIVVPHHGSRTSSSTGFLLAVSPAIAVISSGKNNRYGHPHREVVARYRSMGIAVRNTAEEGTVTVRMGGLFLWQMPKRSRTLGHL